MLLQQAQKLFRCSMMYLFVSLYIGLSCSLPRYLNRTGKHSALRIDSDFIEFLEKDGDLPKSTSTSALSGAGVMRLFSKFGDSLGKITFKMDETDQVCLKFVYCALLLLLNVCSTELF